jgi:hypothetical protein
MRSVLLFLAVGLLWAAACTATSNPDEDCIVNGGICFTSMDQPGCSHPLLYACSAGFVCCTNAYAANLTCNSAGECKTIADASTGAPDVGPDVDAANATKDAAHEAESDAEHDAPNDAEHDVSKDVERGDAPKEATASLDATSHVDAKKD